MYIGLYTNIYYQRRIKTCRTKENEYMIQKVNSPFNESVKLFKIINSYLSLNFVVRFIMYVCWKSICLYLCYIYLMIHKNQETNQNISVKVKLKTYFQLKFIFIMYPHGYTTRPSIYIKFIVFFFKNY